MTDCEHVWRPHVRRLLPHGTETVETCELCGVERVRLERDPLDAYRQAIFGHPDA